MGLIWVQHLLLKTLVDLKTRKSHQIMIGDSQIWICAVFDEKPGDLQVPLLQDEGGLASQGQVEWGARMDS